MAKKRKDADADLGAGDAPADDEGAQLKGSAFDVLDAYGNHVRTYSREDHGKKAGAFAKQFAEKIGGSVNPKK